MSLRLLPTLLALSLLGACGGGADAPVTGGSPAPAPTPASLSLTAQGSSARSTSLAWSPVAGASGYTLERRSDGGSWAVIATPAAGQSSYLDDGLNAATRYVYRLAAPGSGAAPVEREASTTAHAALLTAAAEPLPGPVAAAELGAAGGSLSTADGALRLSVPPGALAAATRLSLQPARNPLPDPLGGGVRVQLAAVPTQALQLSLRYEAEEDAHADGLGVAVQRADGSWLSLPVTAVDKAERRLRVSLHPALLANGPQQRASAAGKAGSAAGMDFIALRFLNHYLSPRQATLQPLATQLLVPHAQTEGLPCWEEPETGCLPTLLIEKREMPFLNQKPGYLRQWFVFADEGGTPALGTVTPRASSGAIYKAPAREPTPNPVVVSFRSQHLKSGRSVTLASTIRVREPVWTMLLQGVLDGAEDLGFGFSAEAVWTREAGGDVYRAHGTQSVHVINIRCTASAAPATVPLPSGALHIDRSVEPARYRLDVGSLWDSSISGSCPGGGFANVPFKVPGQLVAEGLLSGNGQRIEGRVWRNGVTWNWALSSQL